MLRVSGLVLILILLSCSPLTAARPIASPTMGPTPSASTVGSPGLPLPAPRSYYQACLRESQVCSCRLPEATCSDPAPTELFRPLQLPRMTQGQGCPTTPGQLIHGGGFDGVALGTGPVRPIIVSDGDTLHGFARLSSQTRAGWLSFKTLWYSEPNYQGPWRVSGARIDAPGEIAFGESPGLSELLVPPFPTVNGTDGYREAPGGTYVNEPGCYAWQVDGIGFSYSIVIQALPPS